MLQINEWDEGYSAMLAKLVADMRTTSPDSDNVRIPFKWNIPYKTESRAVPLFIPKWFTNALTSIANNRLSFHSDKYRSTYSVDELERS